MKNILRIILVTFVTLLPCLSQAQYNSSEITRMVKDSIISSSEAQSIIQQSVANKTYMMHETQDRIDKITQFAFVAVVIILISLGVLLLIVLIFRYLSNKNKREKEFLLELVDKGAMTNADNDNLNTIINAKKERIITAQNKFLIDATLLGIGGAILINNIITYGRIDDFMVFIAYILFFSGLMRLIVRTVFIVLEIKKKQQKQPTETYNTTVTEIKSNDTQEEQQ